MYLGAGAAAVVAVQLLAPMLLEPVPVLVPPPLLLVRVQSPLLLLLAPSLLLTLAP